MAKELGRLITRGGQKAKNTLYSVAIENIAGGSFFSAFVKAECVMLKALVVLGKIAMARTFCEEVV